MERKYTVVVEPEAEGGFSVVVPDLPGCASQGETFEEAIDNVRDAIACHVQGLILDGLPVPEPAARFVDVQVGIAA